MKRQQKYRQDREAGGGGGRGEHREAVCRTSYSGNFLLVLIKKKSRAIEIGIAGQPLVPLRNRGHCSRPARVRGKRGREKVQVGRSSGRANWNIDGVAISPTPLTIHAREMKREE